MTSEPVCCLPQDTVEQVAQMMKREDIGAVPVVASRDNHQLIGIVTDRDLTMKVIAEGRDSRQTRAEAVMTPDPYVCRANDALQKAIDMMTEQQVRRIPIVDDSGRIVGIIAQADIAIRTENPEQTAEVVEQISQPAGVM
jgi:CBS domain-containing protein